MAFLLALPAPWSGQRWKAKIRDKERNEPPHITVMRGPLAWRWGLREQRFIDQNPNPADVPNEIVDFLRQSLPQLVTAWDGMYPENPVSSKEPEE